MNRYVRLVVLAAILFLPVISALAQPCLKWFGPNEGGQPCIQQCAFPSETGNSYRRLPDRFARGLSPLARKRSACSSGLAVHFYTNSSEIHVRSKVSAPSGLSSDVPADAFLCDLKYIDCNGEWHDLSMEHSRTDCTELVWRGLDTLLQHEYRLFLPLGVEIEQLGIGVPDAYSFKVASPRLEKPVVVCATPSFAYGTASSSSGSRTNRLSRVLDWPVIDFCFEDCGSLGSGLAEALNEVEASVYILEGQSDALGSVRILKAIRPGAAVVLVQQEGQSPDVVLEQLRSEGIDGVRVVPSDVGDAALEAVLRDILLMPDCGSRTMHAVTQRRMPETYDWQETHNETLRTNASVPPRCVFLGDSIIHYWGGSRFGNGRESWDAEFASRAFVNLGMAWDNIQNILWRVNHGELDGFQAEEVIVEGGSNNTDDCTDEEIVDGIIFLLESVRLHQPEARIIYMAIPPCSPDEKRIRSLNRKLGKAVRAAGFGFTDPGSVLLGKDGRIDRSLFVDNAHPNEKGYKLLANRLKKDLQRRR